MRQNKYLPLIILTVITLLSLFVRIWQLDSNPSGLNRDEAALGYNAYLLSETGVDEWGKTWPISLRSFGDYKLAGAVWAIIPFIKLLGFSDWAVRLPIALAGVSLVPLIYVLGRRMGLDATSSLIPAILTAFTPVFIFFSRFGFEAILGLALLVGAIVLFLRKQPSAITEISGALLLLLACLTYNTSLLLTPVVILLLLAQRGVLNWRKWRASVLLVCLVAVISYISVAPASASKQAITIFSDPTLIAKYPEYRSSFSGIFQTILGNEYAYSVKLILERFWNFFTPRFLVFVGGSHPWHQMPASSHLILPTYMLIVGALIYAVFSVIRSWRSVRSKKILSNNLFDSRVGRSFILLVILAFSLLIPSMTVDAPHATRSLFSFLMLFMLVGVMIASIKQVFIRHKKIVLGFTIVLVLNYSWQTIQYLATYFSSYPQSSVIATRSGLASAVSDTENGERVVVVDPDGYEYIRVAWDEGMSADVFMQSILRESPNTLGFTPATQVGRYSFVRAVEAVPPGTPYYIWNGNAWQKSDY